MIAAGEGLVLTNKLRGSLASCWILLPVLFVTFVIYRDVLSSILQVGSGDTHFPVHERKTRSEFLNVTSDILMGGLLAPDHDNSSCLSRYGSASYRKPSPHSPSPYLVQKLRKYEALHRKCGPDTDLYKKSADQIESGSIDPRSECNYVIAKLSGGIGNKVLGLASAFLYALVTDRVLLVERGSDTAQIFCEPFPDTSWLLPLDTPLAHEVNGLSRRSPKSFGYMVRPNGSVSGTTTTIAYVYLTHGHAYHDVLFFCEQDQVDVRKIPFLTIHANIYYVPSLYLIPSFRQEIDKLFPRREALFHQLGRYLFHPSNSVWGLITRFYQDYLANADEKVGLQIRLFGKDTSPMQTLLNQILECTQSHHILPRLTSSRGSSSLMDSGSSSAHKKSKKQAVLVTSLSLWYYEKMKNMYWEQAAMSGNYVAVFQASHEEIQQTDVSTMHDMKAWAEIYLLSLSEVLVTSSGSTFGYVASALAGVRSWLLAPPNRKEVPNPACSRVMSMEPCMHDSPCNCRGEMDETKAFGRDVMRCEDVSGGIKLGDLQ